MNPHGHQWVGDPNDQNMTRMQQDLARGRHFIWTPIISRSNFPDVPVKILASIDMDPLRPIWSVRRMEDFMNIPPDLYGWLLHKGAKDTTVVVKVSGPAVQFYTAADPRNGKIHSLRSSSGWAQEDDDPQCSEQGLS